jgi:hypothetical protein
VVKRKITKEPTMIYKTLHRLLNIEQDNLHKEPVIKSDAPETVQIMTIALHHYRKMDST